MELGEGTDWGQYSVNYGITRRGVEITCRLCVQRCPLFPVLLLACLILFLLLVLFGQTQPRRRWRMGASSVCSASLSNDILTQVNS